MLGDYLRFLNTLCATDDGVRAVTSSDQWFKTLLKLVDVDATTGTYLCKTLSCEVKFVHSGHAPLGLPVEVNYIVFIVHLLLGTNNLSSYQYFKETDLSTGNTCLHFQIA